MSTPPPRFRAWDRRNRRWINGFEVQNLVIPMTHTKVGFQLKTRFELSQFTGIKDCNGRDIYDRDIVEGHLATGHSQSARKRVQRFSVLWNDWSHGWFLHTKTESDWRFFPSFGQCAVIGNLWENPEISMDRMPPIGVPMDVL